MKPITSLTTKIHLQLLLIAAFALSAFAHDPGLSAVDLRFQGDRLEARLAFARADIESLIAIDANGDGRISSEEMDAARAQLDELGRAAIEVFIDGRQIRPAEITTDADESNAINFRLVFMDADGERLQLRSTLISKLAFGHKQFLTLRSAGDDAAGARLLDAKNNFYELDLASCASSAGRPQTFGGFLLLGIEHILAGFDHLAFLLALLIAGGTLREAIKIITSFTVAHSITLALATFDLVNLPPGIVEPMIAASIIYVGLENIYRREINRRWLLTFAFGLVHGFGFATVLRELGIGANAGTVRPLLSFNLGVELGQIAIAALVLPLIRRLRLRTAFVIRYVPACSILLALAGGYWLIERTIMK
jgi:hydrogenase/urease accessory protein HupE